jgi:hypothetical protein
MHELVTEHFGLDTKVARTLATLIRHPGRLTLEFLAGRRVRYVPPLRLYLSLSVLFFLASAFGRNIAGPSDTGSPVKFTTTQANDRSPDVTLGDTTGKRSRSVGAVLDSVELEKGALDKVTGDTLGGNVVSRFFKRRLSQRLTYMKAHKTEATEHISEVFHHDLPDALFLLVPGLALALSALYYGSHRYYSEHLVFALHFQAFSFAALTIGLLPFAPLGGIIGIAVIVYLFLALRKVYGESIGKTIGKLTVLIIGYGLSLGLILGAVGLTAFLFA